MHKTSKYEIQRNAPPPEDMAGSNQSLRRMIKTNRATADSVIELRRTVGDTLGHILNTVLELLRVQTKELKRRQGG